MKHVPLHEFKQHLARFVDLAAAGERIVITRYRRPVVELAAVGVEGLHVGELFGSGMAGPLLRNATGGRLREILEEDRREDR